MYFLFVVLAIPSLIAMLNTLTIGVIERTREIGMLRAVGATRSQIRTMVVAEALLLAGIWGGFWYFGRLIFGVRLGIGNGIHISDGFRVSNKRGSGRSQWRCFLERWPLLSLPAEATRLKVVEALRFE